MGSAGCLARDGHCRTGQGERLGAHCGLLQGHTVPLPQSLGITAAAHVSLCACPRPHHGEKAVECLEGCPVHSSGEVPGPA